MNTNSLLLAALLTAALAPAQGNPGVSSIRRYADRSCSGVLTEGGQPRTFCLAVTAYRTELWLGARRPAASVPASAVGAAAAFAAVLIGRPAER